MSTKLRHVRAYLLICVLALTACGSAPDQAPIFVPAPEAKPSTAPQASSELTLVFAGDVHFVDETLPHLDNPDTAFGPYAEQLRAADFAMVNLETAVTERGAKAAERFHFRAPATAYRAIHAAGIDMVSIANNHTLDYGQVGLADTLDNAKKADMTVVGAGHNVVEAYAPHVRTIKGVRIAVVALSQVWELAGEWKATATRPGIAMAHDRALSIAAVKKARAVADIVIVYLHWGTEDVSCPNNEQKSIAKALATAGADIIIGTHAHVPQGDGYIGKTYVHYGLGNFLWARSGSKDTGLLQLTVKRDGSVSGRKFIVGVVSPNGQPVPITGTALTAAQKRLAQAAKCTGLRPNAG